MRTTEKILSRAGRAGFTLVELLLVIAILGVLATVAPMSTDGIMDDANTSATRTTISSIESAAQTWETRHFKKPDSLDRLLQPDGEREPLLPAKAKTDAWGNEIQYRLNGRKLEIRSAGPDGQMNTSDDITN